jgi:signal recognition particle receptor subunit beta
LVLFNYALKELTAKIVYYGPGLSGKTTNLQYIYEELPIKNKGRMLTLATETDRTLYFDFLPVDAGVVRGIKTRVQLYTVPGQVFYNATRRMVLKGADGIVFVADSQRNTMEANLESMDNLRENLRAHDLNLEQMPLVLQFNKRDLDEISTVEEMNEKLNTTNCPFYEAVASEGIGVEDTLQAISGLVLKTVLERYGGDKKLAPLGAAVSDQSTTDPDPATTDPEAFFQAGGGLFSSEASIADGPYAREARASATTWPSVAETSGGSGGPLGQALDDINIEGLLDDVLSQEEELADTRASAVPGSTTSEEGGGRKETQGAADPTPADLPVPRPDAAEDAFAGLLDEAAGAREVESILEERSPGEAAGNETAADPGGNVGGSHGSPPDEEVEVEIEFLGDTPDSVVPEDFRVPEELDSAAPEDELDPRTSSLSRLMQTRVSISRSELAAVSAPREQARPSSAASGSETGLGSRPPDSEPNVHRDEQAAGSQSHLAEAASSPRLAPAVSSASPNETSSEENVGGAEDVLLVESMPVTPEEDGFAVAGLRSPSPSPLSASGAPGSTLKVEARARVESAPTESTAGLVGKRARLVEVPVRITLGPGETLEEIELLLKIRIERENPPD